MSVVYQLFCLSHTLVGFVHSGKLYIQGFAESLQHQQKALRVEPSLHGRPVVQVFHIRNTQPSTLFVDVAKILQNPVQ